MILATKHGRARELLLAGLLVLICAARGAPLDHVYTFDDPMSWSDDSVPWGLGGAQKWEIADGGKQGKALSISAVEYKQPFSYEIRTLQFNHKPGTEVAITLGLCPVSLPKGSSVVIRHFDGYCSSDAFAHVADEKFKPFPKPLYDSRTAAELPNEVNSPWKTLKLNTGVLQNTVVTLAIIVQQLPPEKEGEEVKNFVEVLIDNMTVKVTALDTLMDPGFDWHGHSGGSTMDFRFSTNAADSDWCDYADQEDVRYWNGQTIHYTLLQQRDASTRKTSYPRHILKHDTSSERLGGLSVVGFERPQAGHHSAASWGVRQTVSYASLGLKEGEQAKVHVTMKMTNDEDHALDFSRVQLGVDPAGGIITGRAIWTDESLTVLVKAGWDFAQLEFARPKGAEAFTIYFRHRDGIPGGPSDPLPAKKSRPEGAHTDAAPTQTGLRLSS